MNGLPASWEPHLGPELKKDYMKNLRQFLVEELQKKKTVFPHGSEIFSAFQHTPFDQVKVVIIGQDPYHGPGQAHGLSFSVKPGVPIPPSLKNIFQEIQSDLKITPPSHGYLVHWARQGVLLLNAVLTVEAGKAASHHGRGWETFTDEVVDLLNREREGLVFLLWGTPAQKKGARIDPKRHHILRAPHPSPLSSYRGFFGCKHFSKTNEILRRQGLTEIDWALPAVIPPNS